MCEDDAIEITKGSDKRLRIEWKDGDDTAIDGTGATARATLKSPVADIEIALTVEWIDRAAGTFDIVIPRAASSQLSDGATNKVIIETEDAASELTIWPPLVVTGVTSG